MSAEIKWNSRGDESTGAHGNVRGYGHTVGSVTDDEGKIVAFYCRQRHYGGANVEAWVIRPEDGARFSIYNKRQFRNIREAWIAKVNEVLG